MGERVRLLVVADDLTGANDTAVSFAAVGYDTLLLLSPSGLGRDAAHPAEVVAVTSDARAGGAAARGLTATAVRQGRSAGRDRLYLKVDSTMRGSVAEQIAGALDAWTEPYPDAVAVICSAYPGTGRTVTDGVLKVAGVDVDRTPSGRDPVCPVTTPRLAELLPGCVVLPNPGDAARLAALIRDAGVRQVVVDAATQDDLAVIAEAVDVLGPAAIPVGSAGLSKEVASRLPAPAAGRAPHPVPIPARRSTLVVVSSRHRVSRQQVDDYLRSPSGRAALVLAPDPEGSRFPASQRLAPAAGHPESPPPGLPELSPTEALPPAFAVHADLPDLPDLPDLAPGSVVVLRAEGDEVLSGDDRRARAAAYAQHLASVAAIVVRRLDVGSLVLVGGDGARATLAALGADRLRVADAIAEGVPLCTVAGGEHDGLVVVTKSGGFGGAELLTTIMKRLQGGRS